MAHHAIKPSTEPSRAWSYGGRLLDLDPTTMPTAARLDHAGRRAVGVPILVGAILDGPRPRSTTATGHPLVAPPAGRQLHQAASGPIAESMPLRSLAGDQREGQSVERDMVAGSGNGLTRGWPVHVGDVICFEEAYDSLSAPRVDAEPSSS